MINQNKVHTKNIIILTINMAGVYHKNFLAMDVNMLKIFQCLQPTLSKTLPKTVILVMH